jgi:uncharacterized protein YbjT (DUF2867 family)
MSAKTALVIRATGAQGKGVTKHLLKAGWAVHALVSDPKDPRAITLQEMGAVLFQGSISDNSSMEAAIKGCTAVYLNLMPSFTDATEESRNATSLLSIAKAAGVQHVVHATSLGLNQPAAPRKDSDFSDHPGVRGKIEVEALVQDCGMTWTIIRPGYFMTNLMPPLSGFMYPELPEGKFVSSYEPDTVLPLVDPSDIGAMATAAMEDPKRFGGKIISSVSEKLSVAQIIEEMSKASGKQIEFVARTPENIEKNQLLVSGETLTKELAALIEMEDVKKWGVPLTSFREFLKEQDLSGAALNQAEIMKQLGVGQK